VSGNDDPDGPDDVRVDLEVLSDAAAYSGNPRSVVERYNFFAMTTPGALILLSM
jgi:hypothetical protein